MTALLETNLAGLPKKRGKVRDVYDLGDRLLLVATDRISAFDWVLPVGIPDKGRVLTGISAFWFRWIEEAFVPVPGPGRPTSIRHHLISTDLDSAGLGLPEDVRAHLVGRSMIVRKVRDHPVRVRGARLSVGERLARIPASRAGLRRAAAAGPDRKPASGSSPIFTPATKAETGHDENVSIERMEEAVGGELADFVAARSLDLYRQAAHVAESPWPDPGRHQIRVGPRSRDRLAAADRRGADARQLAVLAARIHTGRADRSRRSTSSTSATGWTPRAGTRPVPRRPCPPTSWRRTREKYIRGVRDPYRPVVSLEVIAHAPLPDRRRVARAGLDRDRRRVSRRASRSMPSSSTAS